MQTSKPYYRAAAGSNIGITNKACKLMGLVIGNDVMLSQIDISDHVSSGTGNVIVHLEGGSLMTSSGGSVMFGEGIDCNAGLTMTLTNQTNVTVLYQPVGNG